MEKIFKRYLEEGKYCDIFFVVDHKDFELHRMVLATEMEGYIDAHVNIGDKMKSTGTSSDNPIILDKFPGGSTIFEQVIAFCYKSDPFAVTNQNVACLFYASDYFEMKNLHTRIMHFINGKKIEHLFNISKNSCNMENEYSLSNKFTQLCLQKIAKTVSNGRHDEFIEEFLSLRFSADLSFCKLLLEAFESMQVPCQSKHDLMVELILRANLQEDKMEISGLLEAIQSLVRDGLDFTLMTFKQAEKLLWIDECFFHAFDDGRLGFVDKFLCGVENSHVPKRFVKSFLDTFKKMFEQTPESGHVEEKKMGKKFLKVMKQLVVLLVSDEEYFDRESLKVGDLVDAQDSDQVWCEAQIVEAEQATVKVHFKGWNSRWDTKMKRDSICLQPPFSRVKPREYRVGAIMETRSYANPNRWVNRTISMVDHENREVQIAGMGKRLSMDGEDIWPEGTHVSSKRRKLANQRFIPSESV